MLLQKFGRLHLQFTKTGTNENALCVFALTEEEYEYENYAPAKELLDQLVQVARSEELIDGVL
jgi:hypothetical protein